MDFSQQSEMEGMRLLSQIRDQIDYRNNLTQILYKIDRLEVELLIEQRKFKRGSEDYEKTYWDYRNDIDLLEAERDQLESKRLMALARKWGVPIPARPTNFQEENEHWIWSAPHFCHYLSPHGKTHIRRECFAEKEMFYKPWATWLAIGVSFLSLLITLSK